MKCLYLVPDMFGKPGGIARYCQMVALSLIGNAEVEVVALNDAFNSELPFEFRDPRFRYVACQGRRMRFVRQSLLGALRRPDIILVGHVNLALLGVLLAAIVNARTILFAYGIDTWVRLSFVRRRSAKLLGRWISISRFTANETMRENGLNECDVRILPNCLDPRLKPTTGHSRDQFRLLTVSRLTQADDYKGHERILHVLPRLRQKFPLLQYVVVGDGDRREALERLALDLDVSDIVHFTGNVSDSRLSEEYSRAALFVMPSSKEGFGFVFAEALAHGVPIVAGNVDATPEVVVHGENGLLINPLDLDHLKAAIESLLSDPPTLSRFGEHGQTHVREEFTFSEFQAKLLLYLSELAGTAA